MRLLFLCGNPGRRSTSNHNRVIINLYGNAFFIRHATSPVYDGTGNLRGRVPPLQQRLPFGRYFYVRHTTKLNKLNNLAKLLPVKLVNNAFLPYIVNRFAQNPHPVMESAFQLAQRLREVFLHGTFIANTNYTAQLSGTGWQTATEKTGSLNTIAILAQHIHYYIEGVSQVLRGGSLDIKDQYSFDFPPITGQQQWDAFLERFRGDIEAFSDLVEHLPDQQLNAVFVDEKYGTYRRNIEAMIEHGYYHLGQIVIIKKMLSAGK